MNTTAQDKETLNRNVERFRTEIASLETFSLAVEKDIKSFHDKLKAISSDFRSFSSLLSKEDSLSFVKMINDASVRVQEFREQMNVQQQHQAESKKTVFKMRLLEAEKNIDEHYSECMNILKETSDWLKEGKWNMDYARKINPEITEQIMNVRLSFKDMDELWAIWKEVREKSEKGKENIRLVNFELCKTEVKAIEDLSKNADPYDAIKAIMEMQKGLRKFNMGHEHTEQIKTELNNLWEIANARIKERKEVFKEENKRKRDEYKAKKQEWLAKTKSAYDRFTALMEKNSGVIKSIEEQLAQLKDECEAARSDAYRSRIQGWIDEKQTKVNDIKKMNTDLEAKTTKMKKEMGKSLKENKAESKPENKTEEAPAQVTSEVSEETDASADTE